MKLTRWAAAGWPSQRATASHSQLKTQSVSGGRCCPARPRPRSQPPAFCPCTAPALHFQSTFRALSVLHWLNQGSANFFLFFSLSLSARGPHQSHSQPAVNLTRGPHARACANLLARAGRVVPSVCILYCGPRANP